MTDTYDKEATFARITDYAKKRWCWDDVGALEEMFEQSYSPKHDNPEKFVDALAEEFDLADPRDYNFGNDLGM